MSAYDDMLYRAEYENRQLIQQAIRQEFPILQEAVGDTLWNLLREAHARMQSRWWDITHTIENNEFFTVTEQNMRFIR